MTSDNSTPRRKLIEVALPLEAINRESAREKEPFTRRHPRGLHIWWARRPLTAVRAVLFAQIVDDPSSRPDEFPTEDLQRQERDRLHRLIERLATWENSWSADVFEEAYEEILKSSDGQPPRIFDPFAGGGSIPLEAQRLGLSSHASDLNPVAVLINKALVQLPPAFRDKEPVFPGLAESQMGEWSGLAGLVGDIRAYGGWLQDEASKRIGQNYPQAGGHPVVGWIWARTVTCPNPACRVEMPLTRSWWLSRKKRKEAYVVPEVVADKSIPAGRRVSYQVQHEADSAPSEHEDGTVGRTGARCIACETTVPLSYIRTEGREGGLGQQLMAVVAAGERQRVYLSATAAHIEAANVTPPNNVPEASIPMQAPSFRVQAYGMTRWTDLFTDRQLIAMSTFSDLVSEVRTRVVEEGGSAQYAVAISTYLGLAVSRYADLSNALCTWNHTNENVRALFSRQAVPMAWDFVEANVFGPIGLHGPVESVCNAISLGLGPAAEVTQGSARNADFRGVVISTDPPYYDNIGYSDLSDFFYVWLRRSLRDIQPEILSTMLVPKSDELVANPYRHNGAKGAKEFFESGFREVFSNAREAASLDFPITVYYAFKQSESDATGTASSGWETLLEGMITSGWEITSTWPIRSERTARSVGLRTNALASSIVLSLRPRERNAPTTDRREFIASLQLELPSALKKLQQGQIAPVDLPQSAIGPGMAVFSRYSAVLENDGTQMTVRSALARINEILDQVLNAQEGDFDTTTRFAIAWYRQHGYQAGNFGDADSIARARNTSVEAIEREGILASRGGKVTLISPEAATTDYNPLSDTRVSTWELLLHLIARLDREGIEAAADLTRLCASKAGAELDPDLLKELGHLLFRVAESNGWSKDALSFNLFVTSWPEIIESSKKQDGDYAPQQSLDFFDD